jgi:hypothetical protein
MIIQIACRAHIRAQWPARNFCNPSGNPAPAFFVTLPKMEQHYSWPWVERHMAQTAEVWKVCAEQSFPVLPHFTPGEQRKREKAYNAGLRNVEREARRVPGTPAERRCARQRIVDAFPPFAAVALDLKPEATELLTGTFLRVGTELARWAHSFDPNLTVPDTVQACRNAWTACGLQALLGQPMQLTPSLLAYSLLYPYSDNYLDHPSVSKADKLVFSERFRDRLAGRQIPARDHHQAAVWALVELIEEEYPRPGYPQIFDCLLAIHRAQEQSVAQLESESLSGYSTDDAQLLRITCAKGGTSVLADACLAQPWLSEAESRFAFEWGVLLQLGDDLQDVQEDLRRGSVTLFTRAATAGQPLDSLVVQLLSFSRHVGDCMHRLPHGSEMLKDLLRMSWRSLILMAVADAKPFFTESFLAELEPCSPFRFDFLLEKNRTLAARESLYARLFDAFVEASPPDPITLPVPAFAVSDLTRLHNSSPCLESAMAVPAS